MESKASLSAEILAILPHGWKDAAATVNGEPAEAKLLSSEPYLFAELAVPKGISTVVVSERQEAGVAVQLLPPGRNPYEDRGVTFFSASEKPTMRRHQGLQSLLGDDRAGRFHQPLRRAARAENRRDSLAVILVGQGGDDSHGLGMVKAHSS